MSINNNNCYCNEPGGQYEAEGDTQLTILPLQEYEILQLNYNFIEPQIPTITCVLQWMAFSSQYQRAVATRATKPQI